MVDQLYPLTDLVLTQGGRLVALGPPAGPAGASTVELQDGSVWQVDHVEGATLIALEAVGADPTRSPLMITAFGGDGAMFMADRAVALGADISAEENHISGSRPGPLRYDPQTHPRLHRPAREAGHLLQLADSSGDHRLHPLARAAAAMEFSLSVRTSPVAKVLWPLSPNLVDIAERLAGEVDDQDLLDLDPTTAAALLSLCRSALERGRGGASGIGQLADRVQRIWDADDGVAVASLMIPDLGTRLREDGYSDLAADDDDEPVALAIAAPPPPESDQQQINRSAAGLVRIGMTRSTAPRWARILHRRGLVLLGQAPLSREGLMDVAEVVVPTDVPDSELEVQIVDREELTVPVSGPADAIRSAVAAGRDAARSDRLGNHREASTRWIRCSDLWAGIGDTERSDQARTLARGASYGTHMPPSASDQVAAALEASA